MSFWETFSGPGRARQTTWLDQAMLKAVGLLASALMLVGATMADPAHETGVLLAVG